MEIIWYKWSIYGRTIKTECSPYLLIDARDARSPQVRPCRLTFTKLARALWNADQPRLARELVPQMA